MIKLSDFDYVLPDELVACKPAIPRDNSRLLVLGRVSGRTLHQHFFNIAQYCKPGDVLVLNETKVFPARLLGEKISSGGKVEILLNHELEAGLWEAIGRNLKVGEKVRFSGSELEAKVVGKSGKIYQIRINMEGIRMDEEIEKIGHTPLPPYITRIKNHESRIKQEAEDRKNYQTVYAKERGSVAAPTAGLHFTPKLLADLEKMGVQIEKVTLHVGLGTFAPIEVEDASQHQIHPEYFSVNKDTIAKIKLAKKEDRRIIAVGTTTTRVLEALWKKSQITPLCQGFKGQANHKSQSSHPEEAEDRREDPKTSTEISQSYLIRNNKYLSGWTNIYIYPGFKFKCIDGLITNFHLPKSSLLLLVFAFAGQEKIKKAYQEAISQKYRFYSYGDAMLII